MVNFLSMHPIVVHPELSNVATENVRKGVVTKAVIVIELLIPIELSLTGLLSIKSWSINVPLRLSKRLNGELKLFPSWNAYNTVFKSISGSY